MEFICLDIETTGLDLETCEIIEVSAVRFNREEILETYQSFVHYNQEIPEIVQHLTGIDVSMTENAPELDAIKQEILDFCQDLPIVGHNINFDINFLKKKGVPLENTLFDTLPLSHILIKDITSHSLEVLSNTFNKKYFPTHRAQDDCLANIELFWMFLKLIEEAPDRTAYLWTKILSKTNDEFSTILQKLIPAKPEQPTLAPKYYQPDKVATSANVQKVSKNITDLMSAADQNALFVTSDLTERNFKAEYTKVPDINSEICPDKFYAYLEKETISYDETILLLKLAVLFSEKNTAFKEDLNLFGEDYNYINQLTTSKYQIPESTKPYLVSHFVFFRLIANNKLPYFENIIFEELPFLEEIYVRANEKRISHNSISESNNLDSALEFRNLTNFADRIKATENAEFYDTALLDIFTFEMPEFQQFLARANEMCDIQDTKDKLADLKQNFKNYLVWIANPQQGYNREKSDLAYIGYINKNIDLQFDLEKIIQELNCTNATLATGEAINKEIEVLLPENLPDPNDPAYNNIVPSYIFEKLKNLTTQAVIISPANVQIQLLHKYLALPLNDLGINLVSQGVNASKGKILHNLENNEAPTVLLCTQYFFLRNFPSVKKLEELFITKLPMGLPNHIFYEYKKTKSQNSFMELIVPNTAQTVYQILEQAMQENPEFKSAHIMDSRLYSKSWGKSIAQNFPNNIILKSCQ
jgi:DNA polymerase III epsilon subunit-like protein